ncbi:MAG: nucleotide exchange factor GrpE [Candidatus Omnitrophica bacterium]|nr:nucleotide exchange factor GrpE [Candidatus Omnitrophota bacterium]MBU4590827.1 nucleotide exchange factor GrpE [Candidatus Omnitrophota bacterium]
MAEHNHKKEHKKNNILLGFEEFEALKKKADESIECFDRLLRLQAEFDNYKKRLEKDRLEFVKFANEEIIMEVLNVLDDFERAVKAGKSKHDFDVLYKGIEMIWKDMNEFLKKKGVKEIDTQGKPFNPHEHEAMMQEERDDCPEDHVTEEFQKGYMLNDRIIRPAKVKVSKRPKGAPRSPERVEGSEVEGKPEKKEE